VSFHLYSPSATCSLALTGGSLQGVPAASTTSLRKIAIASRPWYRVGRGGIAIVASWASIETTEPTFARSQASTNRSTISRNRSSSSARRVICWLRDGSRSSTVLCARCSAVSTAAGVMSSVVAHFPCREPEHVAQDQDSALPGRDALKRCDERELDALALLVSGVRRGESVLEFDVLVRVRLQPAA